MNTWACDTETTGLDIIKDKPFLYLAYNGKDYIVERTPKKFLEIISNPENTVLFHNLKFDAHMLKNVDIEIKANAYCTLLCSHLLNENRPSRALKALVKTELNRASPGDAALETYFKENKIKENERDYSKVPWAIMEPYACEDVKNTFDLWTKFKPQIETQDLMPLLERESKLAFALMRMEKRGVLIDKDATIRLNTKLTKLKQELEDQIYTTYGSDWKISSNLQLGAKLKALGINVEYTEHKTKPKICVNKYALAKYNHPIVPLIQRYRKLSVYQNTFCKGILKHIDNENVLRANFISWGTVTGRFSCSNINLQNTPKPKISEPETYWIREVFVPRPGFFNLYLDYDQIEYRIIAGYSKDNVLIDAINKGQDVHTVQAQKLFKVVKVTKEQRTIAKTLNFAMVYGAGVRGVAKLLDIVKNKAIEILELFKRTNPLIAILKNKIKSTLRQRGYIYNKFKRRYHIPLANHHVGLNYIGQGSASDMLKDAMVKADALLLDYESNMILTAHDELGFELIPDEIFLVKELKTIMENYSELFNINIKVSSDITTTNWAEKKELIV